MLKLITIQIFKKTAKQMQAKKGFKKVKHRSHPVKLIKYAPTGMELPDSFDWRDYGVNNPYQKNFVHVRLYYSKAYIFPLRKYIFTSAYSVNLVIR